MYIRCRNGKLVGGFLFSVALIFCLSGVASADWEVINIGGGSMKRHLFDANNDGYVDSLTVNYWYKNPGTGAGNWPAVATGWNEEKWNGSYQVGHPDMVKFVDGQRAGDINGDGLPDMVVGTYGDDYLQGVPVPAHMQDSIYVAINPGDEGEWDLYYIGKLPATDDGVETVAIGDMNNDGYPDILAGGECTLLRWYVNPGTMQDNWSYYTVYDFSQDVEGMVIKDFNNDDYLDIAVTTCAPYGGSGGVYVLTNPQTESGNWARTTLSSSRRSCFETISAGDIDGDGWDDVVFSNSQPWVVSELYWYENPQGSGSWTRRTIDTLSSTTHLKGSPPEVADIDLDGKPDVICYRYDSSATYWYKNPGGGSNWAKTKIYNGNIGSYKGVGDVDREGDPDIICGGYWYVNPTESVPFLPYETGFESGEGFVLGDIHNQNGWQVTEGTAAVQSDTVYTGSRAVEVSGQLHKSFSGNNNGVQWIDFYLQPVTGSAPELPSAPKSSLIYFDANQGVMCFDGNGNGTGQWVVAEVNISSDTWYRITICQDYDNCTWDCYVDEELCSEDLGFKDDCIDSFNLFQVRSLVPSVSAYLDDILFDPYIEFLPYETGFESNEGFGLGNLHNQNGWQVTEGTAAVQSDTVYAGTQAVVANGEIRKSFSGVNDGIQTIDFYLQPVTGIEPDIDSTPSASLIYFDFEDGVMCYDGNGDGSGDWVAAGVNISSGTWYRITIRQDYTGQTWSLYVNDILKLSNLGFRHNAVSSFNLFNLIGSSCSDAYLDALDI